MVFFFPSMKQLEDVSDFVVSRFVSFSSIPVVAFWFC